MRILILALFLFNLFACSHKEKEKMIYGRLSNSENSWILLQKITDQGEETLDSALAKRDGSFEIRNPAGEPDFYVLRTNPSNLIFLLIDKNENVEVNGDANNLELTYKVSGSKDSELIQQLRSHDRKLSDSLNRTFEVLGADNPEKRDSIGRHLQQTYSGEMENFALNFIKKNLNSLVSLSATKFINQQAELKLMTELRDTLSKRYPENRYVNDYALLINELKKLPTGSISPEIVLNSPEGKTISLSSFRGKVVLIDFWASWCGPCRIENPKLVNIYNKFKGNEFEILGISLDENLSAWKNAIIKDGLTWPQASDLKRWNSKVVKDFHIDAIPFSILIDRDGKIIGKGLRSDELEFRIAEALKVNS